MTLDIFTTDAFSVVALTDAVRDMPFVPGRLGELGIFQASGVDTTTIAVEQKGDILTVLPPTPRGAPGTTVDKAKRNIRDLRIPHFEINDAIYADEVQNVRAFGRESETETVMAKVAARINETHLPSHSWTEEQARIGAIKGIVTYADGSTLNLFTEFGVVQETVIDFDLLNVAPVSGALRAKCQQVIRQVSNLLGGIRFSFLHAFCGDAFFDALIAHKEVVASYTATDQAAELRRSYVEGGSSFGTFNFGGILWENYRGLDHAGSPLIPTDEAQIIPRGVQGLFRSIWAPADYNETVNTIGRRLYVKQYAMPNDKGIHLDSQMNALHYCTRPKVLIPATRGAAP